jgi:DNA-directed RNA polymerase subunit M/transcription elongation factor TFIIS
MATSAAGGKRFGGAIRVGDIQELPTIIPEEEHEAVEGDLGLDPKQVTHLKTLRYPDGTSVFDFDRIETIVDVIGLIKELGYKQALEYIAAAQNYDELRNNSPMMEPAREKFLLDLSIMTDKDEGVEGLGICHKCQGTKLKFYQKQTRGSDEAMTTFVTCVKCGNRWRA